MNKPIFSRPRFNSETHSIHSEEEEEEDNDQDDYFKNDNINNTEEYELFVESTAG